MKQSRGIALLLSLALLCALCGCVTAPAVSEPESEPTTTAATVGTTTTATETPTTAETTSPMRVMEDEAEAAYKKLFPDEAAEKAAYESYKKMSYKEYFSEPRFLISKFRNYRMVEPLDSDPTKIVDADNHNEVYFDAKKYKKDAKQARGGYKGDGIVDYFCVDGEIWRWHIPSDTVDVVIKHDGLCGIYPLTTDFGYCFVLDTPGSTDGHPGHYHVFSKNLTIPFDDIDPPIIYDNQAVPWLEKNVYNKK